MERPVWPHGHLIILEPGTRKMGRCDCGGMSAANPSHTELGVITTDTLVASRILHGRDPVTGRKLD